MPELSVLLAAVSLSPAAALAVGAAAGALVALALAAVAARRMRRRLTRDLDDARSSQALLEQAPDAVLVHALDGTGLVPNASASAALELGPGGGSLSVLDVVALGDQTEARDHLTTLATQGAARSDLHLRGPGADRLFDVSSRVIGGRVLTVARDVGDRAERERQALAARDQALADVRDKSAFLDSMSHDLRTPLTAVLGFAELLRDEVSVESRGLADAIANGGQRLLRTLDAVLDLARLDAGRQTLHPAPLDVADVAAHIAGRYREVAQARGLALSVETRGPVPATLDPSVLNRVLGTLVGNAISFTETGGVTVEVVDDADTVTLRVLDTGIGIADDVLPDLFSEHRLQPGTPGQAPVGVTALGLAVTRRLVELAGGTISVESHWGQGSAFTVVLPRGPIPEPAPALAASPLADAVASPLADAVAR